MSCDLDQILVFQWLFSCWANRNQISIGVLDGKRVVEWGTIRFVLGNQEIVVLVLTRLGCLRQKKVFSLLRPPLSWRQVFF